MMTTDSHLWLSLLCSGKGCSGEVRECLSTDSHPGCWGSTRLACRYLGWLNWVPSPGSWAMVRWVVRGAPQSRVVAERDAWAGRVSAWERSAGSTVCVCVCVPRTDGPRPMKSGMLETTPGKRTTRGNQISRCEGRAAQQTRPRVYRSRVRKIYTVTALG